MQPLLRIVQLANGDERTVAFDVPTHDEPGRRWVCSYRIEAGPTRRAYGEDPIQALCLAFAQVEMQLGAFLQPGDLLQLAPEPAVAAQE